MSVKTDYGWRGYCQKHGERRIRIEEGNKLAKKISVVL